MEELNTEELKEQTILNNSENKKLTPKQISSIITGVFVSILVVGAIVLIAVLAANRLGNNNINYKYITFGETVEFENISLKVNGYQISTYADGGTYYAGDDNYWILIDAEITNLTNKTISIYDYSENISYGLGENSANYNSSFTYSDYFILSSSEVLPFGSTKGVYAYRVPRTIIEKEASDMGGSSFKFDEENNFYFRFYLDRRNHSEELVIKL